MRADFLISVVLPVYRNRAVLPELYRRLTEVLESLTARHELVFVDDAGGDGSLEWLRECRAHDDRVVVVEQPQNMGQHPAVIAGLRRSGGDFVVVMDADLQDAPEDVPTLVRAIAERDGVVFARRSAPYQSRGRHLTGRLFKRLLRRISGSRVPSGTGMFFVASRRVVTAAVARSDGARYVPLLLDRAGVPMTAIDIAKQKLVAGSSAYSSAGRIRLALGAIRQALEERTARK